MKHHDQIFRILKLPIHRSQLTAVYARNLPRYTGKCNRNLNLVTLMWEPLWSLNFRCASFQDHKRWKNEIKVVLKNVANGGIINSNFSFANQIQRNMNGISKKLSPVWFVFSKVKYNGEFLPYVFHHEQDCNYVVHWSGTVHCYLTDSNMIGPKFKCHTWLLIDTHFIWKICNWWANGRLECGTSVYRLRCSPQIWRRFSADNGWHFFKWTFNLKMKNCYSRKSWRITVLSRIASISRG